MGWWALGAAAVLQLIAGVVRVRAWFHVIRHSCPDEPGVRYRDVALAQVAGSGWNAILPARAGDAVKIALVNRRMQRRRLTTLAATTVPPALVEAAFTVLLLAALVGAGLMSVKSITHGLPATTTVLIVAGAAVIALVAGLIFRRRIQRLVQNVVQNVRAGLSVLREPKIVAT